MYFFQCKLCGGRILFEKEDTVGECESCSVKQTLPRLDDDKKANLYDRANHFRRNNEFDKAMAIYEKILEEDSTDAEAYWSLNLCRYGIEYVEDPATHKRIPTVNRTHLTSIFAEEDYKSALRYADDQQRKLYEAEARAIDEIQKGILEISSLEEDFDVFICYKETDENGKRTPDSVLANDLYHQLIQEGFKVFFSRITLEDIIGRSYEPYIFAALNSAKVMVVLGTKPEYFNAPWVKNEWSRYLALIRKGEKKTLIPAYRDMDPYDLPEEFSHLQGQDMSRLGFMQDLLRGIRKIAGADEGKPARETIVINNNAADTGSAASLLERAFLFLEDGNWQDADEYCERVLDREPRNPGAYLGKLMAELHVRRQGDLEYCDAPFDDRNNYQKAIRFADGKLAGELRGYIAAIRKRNEKKRRDRIYDSAMETMKSAETKEEYRAAAEGFRSVSGYKDADAHAEECLKKAEICWKNEVYDRARSKMSGQEEDYREAIRIFLTIAGWKDAEEQIAFCRQKIEECEAREEEARMAALKAAARRKKLITAGACACAAGILFLIFFLNVILPKQKWNRAAELLEEGEYEAASALLGELKDSKALMEKKYNRALEFTDAENYEAVYLLLRELDYKDSAERREAVLPHYTESMVHRANPGDLIVFGAYEQDNNMENGKEMIEWYVLAKEENRILVLSKYALDYQPYHEEKDNVTWETCDLREWLNQSFVKEAFEDGEQARIAVANVSAEKGWYYQDIDPGNDTQDKVFLLSNREAAMYSAFTSGIQCEYTQYIRSSRGFIHGISEINWWLRTPGYQQNYAECIDEDYGPYSLGNPSISTPESARPCGLKQIQSEQGCKERENEEKNLFMDHCCHADDVDCLRNWPDAGRIRNAG